MRGDLLATTGYVANWHFIETSTYFADIGVDSPLEHTWSLAIEEQFYLLWPLLVSAVAAVGVRARAGVGTVAVVGVIASAGLLALLWAPGDVERAYMGTDARIFEPMLGAAGAAFVASPGGRARIARAGRWVLAAGAAAVCIGLVTIAPGDRGYFLGGAVLISAGTLALAPCGWAPGRHRPVLPLVAAARVDRRRLLRRLPLALAGHALAGVRDPWVDALVLRQIAAALLTFGIAAVSFSIVERPIRSGTFLAARRAPAAHAAGAATGRSAAEPRSRSPRSRSRWSAWRERLSG